MKNQSNHSPSNFWFGFSIGAVAAVAASYLLGTKKGRETLKKVIAMSEQFPERIPEIIEKFQKIAAEKSKENKFSGLQTIDSVIKKIKQSSGEKHQ